MTRIFDTDLRDGPSTRAIHAGQKPDPVSGAIMTPLYLTSTYVHEEFGVHRGYEYARGKNPTREALERNGTSPRWKARRMALRLAAAWAA